MAYQGYKLAVNWNNAAGLAFMESALPRYQNKPMIVQGRGTWSDGILNTRADLAKNVTGNATFIWRVPVMGIVQYVAIQQDYMTANDGYSGKVTARTRGRDDNFANFSATMYLPMMQELERKQDAFRNVELYFVVEAAL